MLKLPKVAFAYCPVETSPPVNIEDSVAQQMSYLLAEKQMQAGQSVAVAVGSRGIADLSRVISTIIKQLKQRNLVPFIIPAMGSHGGATAQGQKGVLNSLGILADDLGVEFRAEMETEHLGETSDAVAVHFSRVAISADHVLLCNRIKPHTNFAGTIQSGLQKMLTIGLGKATGAAAYHRASHDVPFDKMIRESVELIRQRISLLGGIALLENSHKQLCLIEAVPCSTLAQREPELLHQAEALMPRLPISKIDLLIIDEIGKEISGTGLDTNVVGRKYNDHVSDQRDWCQTRFIHVRGLTEATAGNATGIGIAEFCTQSVVEQIAWPKTIINAITAGHPTSAMCPVAYQSDREVIDAVLRMLGEQAKIVQIKNTLQPNRLLVSQSCLKELKENEPEARISDLYRMNLTPNGNLPNIADHC